jgi:hypothetical protein
MNSYLGDRRLGKKFKPDIGKQLYYYYPGQKAKSIIIADVIECRYITEETKTTEGIKKKRKKMVSYVIKSREGRVFEHRHCWPYNKTIMALTTGKQMSSDFEYLYETKEEAEQAQQTRINEEKERAENELSYYKHKVKEQEKELLSLMNKYK